MYNNFKTLNRSSDYDPHQYWLDRGGEDYMQGIMVPEYRTHQAAQEKFIIEYVLSRKPERLLDFGCGTGKLFHLWHEYVRFPEGYDISASMLETAHKKVKELFGDHVRSWQFPLQSTGVDRTKLPYQDVTFDAIVACEVLAHILSDELDGTIKDLHRILKPGGVLALVVPMPFSGGAAHNFSHDYNLLLPKYFRIEYDWPREPYRHILCVKTDE